MENLGGEQKSPLYLSFYRKTFNSKVFQNILHSKILPRPNIVYREHKFVLVKDITPPHTSRLTVSCR